MLRTWVVAGIALTASTGPILGQDAAAGEQVFKRLCSPCHEIGPDAKIKLGPPLNGIDGRCGPASRSTHADAAIDQIGRQRRQAIVLGNVG